MLSLTRKLNERIQIGDDITIIVSRIFPSRVRLAIEAPGKRVMRSEVIGRERREDDGGNDGAA